MPRLVTDQQIDQLRANVLLIGERLQAMGARHSDDGSIDLTLEVVRSIQTLIGQFEEHDCEDELDEHDSIAFLQSMLGKGVTLTIEGQ